MRCGESPDGSKPALKDRTDMYAHLHIKISTAIVVYQKILFWFQQLKRALRWRENMEAYIVLFCLFSLIKSLHIFQSRPLVVII